MVGRCTRSITRAHGHGLATSRDSEQGLVRETLRSSPFDQLLDGLRLIARGLVIGFEFERNFVPCGSMQQRRIDGAVRSDAR
jgi:hypothetical protein